MKFRTMLPALLLVAALPIACTYAAKIPGDCTGDGMFDQGDARLVKSYLLGQVELSPWQLAAADLSGDGLVSITDLLQMQRFLTGRTSAPSSPGRGHR